MSCSGLAALRTLCSLKDYKLTLRLLTDNYFNSN